MYIFEAIVCLVSLAGYGYLIFYSLGLDSPKKFWDGPGAFPFVLSVLCLILCIIWAIDIFSKIRKVRKGATDNTIAEKNTKQGFLKRIVELWSNSEIRNLTIIIALTVLYVLVLMPLTGFVISTLLFLFSTIFLFYERKWLTAIIVSVVTTGVVYLLFTFVFHLPLPR